MHQEKKMLAHISEDGTRVQTVADHLQGTAVLCGQFAAAFDAQQQGTWLGLLLNIVQSFKSACKVERKWITQRLVHRWLPDMVKFHWLLLLRDTIAACRMEEAEAIPRRMRQCLGD